MNKFASTYLNINLINLPLRLIDYVIYHELVHTIEKNHSVKFWNLLKFYLPEAMSLNKELNKNKLSQDFYKYKKEQLILLSHHHLI